jgi:hypothetical protein
MRQKDDLVSIRDKLSGQIVSEYFSSSYGIPASGTEHIVKQIVIKEYSQRAH